MTYAPNWLKDKDGNTVERSAFDYMRDYLGYRLSATQLSVKELEKGKLSLTLSLQNYGMAAAFNMISRLVILDENGQEIASAEREIHLPGTPPIRRTTTTANSLLTGLWRRLTHRRRPASTASRCSFDLTAAEPPGWTTTLTTTTDTISCIALLFSKNAKTGLIAFGR